MAERWLVIDDSSTIQRVIKLAFQGYDVVISEADTCQEAAREIMLHPPSLVIADAALGGVQGVQDFLALKGQAPQAPFIILEGSYDNIDEVQFRAAGFQHFLKKPFDGAQLLSITRQALGRALPYRGEAAVAAAAGAPQPHAQPTMTMPPPPPPVRARPATEAPGSFPPESTGGFDLGLQDSRSHQAPDSRSSSVASSPLAQTIVSEVRAVAQHQVAAELRSMSGGAPGSGAFQRKDAAVETVRNPMSFSLEDDELVPQATAAAMGSARSDTSVRHATTPMPTNRSESNGWDSARTNARPAESSGWDNASAAQRPSGSQSAEPAGWEGPRPAGSHLGNLLEPMLQEEMEKLVRVAVEEYCRKHFTGIARELIQRELDRLTQDRSRLLMD